MNDDCPVRSKHSESSLQVSQGTFEGVVGVDEDDVVGYGPIEEVADVLIFTAKSDIGAVLETGRTAVHEPVAPVKAGAVDSGELEAGGGSADFKVSVVAIAFYESINDFVFLHVWGHRRWDLEQLWGRSREWRQDNGCFPGSGGRYRNWYRFGFM